MNTDELESAVYQAERRVLGIQAKLHLWARDDPPRRFDDLFNLVADPAFLLVGWDRVRGNKGARTAGVDGRTAVSIALRTGVEEFLVGLRVSLKDRSFRPLPVRERMIPKTGGKKRRLGIATITDRVVQARSGGQQATNGNCSIRRKWAPPATASRNSHPLALADHQVSNHHNP